MYTDMILVKLIIEQLIKEKQASLCVGGVLCAVYRC